MRLIVWTTLWLLALSVAPANGQMTVKQYQANMASRDTNRIAMTHLYVLGLSEGMSWAEFERRSRLKTTTPLYCVPEKFSLNDENLLDIINKEINFLSTLATPKETDTLSIGMLLMKGLERTFPCKG